MLNYSTDPMIYINSKVEERFKISQDKLLSALHNKDINTLRKASNLFFYTSGEYRRLVEYRANLLRNDYIVFPTKDCTKGKHKAISDYLDKQNIKEIHANIALHVMRDGVWYGYERELNGSIFFQTLDYTYCRSRFILDGVRSVEFDLTFFAGFRGDELTDVFNGMPEEIVLAYKRYLSNRSDDNRWALLDNKRARCHMLVDEFPPLAPVMLDILNLERYKQINLMDEELSVYKILVQKLPLDKNGELPFLKPEIDQFHRNLRKMIKRPIDVVTTPCDIDSIDLEKRAKETGDRVESALNTIYSTAGTPMLLFNSGSGGAYGLKESINVDIAAMLPLHRAYESWYRQRFSEYGGKGTVILQFLTTTEHSKFDMLESLQAASSLGYPTRLMTSSVLDVRHMDDLLAYENDTLDLPNEMIPAVSGYNSSQGAGAPEKKESQLSDEGLKTRVGEKNLLGGQ